MNRGIIDLICGNCPPRKWNKITSFRFWIPIFYLYYTILKHSITLSTKSYRDKAAEIILLEGYIDFYITYILLYNKFNVLRYYVKIKHYKFSSISLIHQNRWKIIWPMLMSTLLEDTFLTTVQVILKFHLILSSSLGDVNFVETMFVIRKVWEILRVISI